MQVADSDLEAYLKHRLGEARIAQRQRLIHRRALELNMPSVDFAETFGRATIPAYVGFVDLAGFSTTVSGKTPSEIAEYLEPWLRRLVTIIRRGDALIDKTIGDEVMFVLPETEEDGCPEILYLGQMMGGLHDLAFEMADHPFRIGLSYGGVRFFHIEGVGYSEWTAVGEPVHVAKRLHSLPELETPNPVIGAFGMSVGADSVEKIRRTMTGRLGIFAGFASRFDHSFADAPIPLKGVGDVLYAILSPRPERAPGKLA